MLLAVALALLLAQAIGAVLVYRAQAERREAALVHAAAFRLRRRKRASGDVPQHVQDAPRPMARRDGRSAGFRIMRSAEPRRCAPRRSRDPMRRGELRDILDDQDIRRQRSDA